VYHDNTDDIVRIDAQSATGSLAFGSNGEAFRVDSSKRLLVGTSSSRSFNTHQGALQIDGDTYSESTVAIISNSNTSDGAYLLFVKQRSGSAGGNTVVQNNDIIGEIRFNSGDGTDCESLSGQIQCLVDGTPGSNDVPGRLVFSTTADGASSPTERMRIDNLGRTGFGETSPAAQVHSSVASGTDRVCVRAQQAHSTALGFFMQTLNASYAGDGFRIDQTRSATSACNFFICDSAVGGSQDREFTLRGDGNAFADGTWAGGGADYAEYFEWSDGNLDEEDRRGISVVLDGNQIRPAFDDEDPIGVISGNPSVVGDAAWNKWVGKYLRDEFGTYILEDYEVINDEGETVIQQRRKLNPAYDPDQEYINREQRPEWDCVGLMGKLRIRKGQPTGSRWIKMRDISDSVEEWLVR